MKKIPTLFERDWLGDKSRVVDKVHPGCEWVLAGEGVATRKLDGTSCRVKDGKLWKRRELRPGEDAPPDFELVDHDEQTGKTIGWLPVTSSPEDRWHIEAFSTNWGAARNLPNGTYELVGPKVQGNPERYESHVLVPHSATGVLEDVPLTFEGIRAFLDGKDIEGIVFQHPDGRMAKIKLRDFGLKRPR